VYVDREIVASQGKKVVETGTNAVGDHGQGAARPQRLLDQVRMAARRLHSSIRIEDAYTQWVKRFVLFHGKRHPVEMGEAEVIAFLDALAVDRNVAASTQNQAPAALLFLYKVVLDRPLEWVGDDVVRAKRPERLPVVLTRDEVRAVLAQLEGTAWLMASLL
jgi:integrase